VYCSKCKEKEIVIAPVTVLSRSKYSKSHLSPHYVNDGASSSVSVTPVLYIKETNFDTKDLCSHESSAAFLRRHHNSRDSSAALAIVANAATTCHMSFDTTFSIRHSTEPELVDLEKEETPPPKYDDLVNPIELRENYYNDMDPIGMRDVQFLRTTKTPISHVSPIENGTKKRAAN
jgi:hypothetical protein